MGSEMCIRDRHSIKITFQRSDTGLCKDKAVSLVRDRACIDNTVRGHISPEFLLQHFSFDGYYRVFYLFECPAMQ